MLYFYISPVFYVIVDEKFHILIFRPSNESLQHNSCLFYFSPLKKSWPSACSGYWQKYIGRLFIHWNWTIHSDICPTLPFNFL